MKSRSILAPILVGLTLLAMIAVMAATDIFQPLVQFIHTGEITLQQAALCLLAALAAFGLVLWLLVLLGGYFLPKAEHRRKQSLQK